MNAKAIALAARAALEDKQGIDPIILDIRKLTSVADYFLLVHGNSDRHVRTLADAVLDTLHEKKIKPHHTEGLQEAKWILIDYGSVMIHVFHRDTRAFYNLERLWGEGKILNGSPLYEKRPKKTR